MIFSGRDSQIHGYGMASVLSDNSLSLLENCREKYIIRVSKNKWPGTLLDWNGDQSEAKFQYYSKVNKIPNSY